MDYAFGPTGGSTPDDPTGVLRQMGFLQAATGSGSSTSTDPLVAQAQSHLNRLGLGPLSIDGILGPKTTSALTQWYASRGMSWNGQVTQATVDELAAAVAMPGPSLPAPATPAALQPQAVPFYKNPLFIALAVAGLGTVGYLMWRAEDIKRAFAGDDEPEGDEEPVKGRRRRSKAERAKCALTPEWDSSSTPVRRSLTEIPYAEPVKE